MGMDERTAPPADAGTRPDGREMRSVRTRAAIVDAWLSLVEDGNFEPTARTVAERAGIGLRTLYQHFDDLDALHNDAAQAHLRRISPFIVAVRDDGPLTRRIRELVTARSKLYERVGPVRRAALRLEHRHAAVARALAGADERFEREIESVFSGELESLARTARGELLASLDVALSFASWDHLRRRRCMSVPGARRVVTAQLTALLGGE